jgi:NAD(P)-dependent dehydrogenase (short-subunit alcohol dehydrogenase family)
MQKGTKVFPTKTLRTKPGLQLKMPKKPVTDDGSYKSAGKLEGKVAIITGGDSGIGQAIAVVFAKEGADVTVGYLNETKDADLTKTLVEKYGGRCLLYKGDIGDEKNCEQLVSRTIKQFKKLNILINNAAEQHPKDSIKDISRQQLEKTYRTNMFSMFYMIKAALPHLSKGSSIINTASVTAYRGSPHLLDYSSTKGAIISFTRSLSSQLADKDIRVNAVAPGPIWTPLIPSTFPPEKVKTFGQDVPMGRAGQPSEVAPAFVFLASSDASYITGQTIHVNGGEVVNA